MNSYAIESYQAQNIFGFEHVLSPVSSGGQWKMEMNSADHIVYATVNGGAWFPVFNSGGIIVPGGTLDADYQNGPAGNTILMTDAKGPIAFSSAITNGSILALTTTNAPGTVTAQVTGIAIDMSSLGTAATPSTFDLPAITVNGPYSSVAKARGSALVQIAAAYRNASALSIGVKNKQALSGSIIQVGWDATNYEGAAASSVLTGTTHMLTLDGVTNVDASTNNVEFLNLRCLVPQTDTLSGTGILIQRGSDPVSFAQPFLRITDDVGNATTPLQGIAIALTPALATIQTTGLVVSVNGLLSTISGAASFSYGALAGTTRGTVRIFGPLGGPTTGAHTHLSVGDVPTSQTLGAALTGISVPLGTNVSAGANAVNGVTVSLPASTSSSTRGFNVDSLQKAGVLFRGAWSGATTLTGTTIALDVSGVSNVTGNSQVYVGVLVAAPNGVANTGSNAARFAWNSDGGTGTSGNEDGIVSIEGAGYRNVTLTGGLRGLNINLSTNGVFSVTPGAQALIGLNITIPATTRASTAGEGAVVIDSRATAARAIDCAVRNTSGGAWFLRHGASTTLSGAWTGVGLDCLTNITPSGNSVSGIYIAIAATAYAPASTTDLVGGIVIDNHATTQPALKVVNYQTSGNVIDVAFNTTTISGTLNAINVDLQNNITATTPAVVAVNVTVPGTSSTGAAAFKASSAQTGGSVVPITSTGSGAVVGITVTMGSGATGAALVLTHGRSASNQLIFSNATDGSAFHLLGPSAGQLRIGAGTPATAGAGREIALVASDAGATSGGAGGSIYLQEGAGNGGGARGQIAIGQSANMRLGFFAGGPATQQTPTGSRGGNAALASLLTALAAYGLIVDGTSA